VRESGARHVIALLTEAAPRSAAARYSCHPMPQLFRCAAGVRSRRCRRSETGSPRSRRAPRSRRGWFRGSPVTIARSPVPSSALNSGRLSALGGGLKLRATPLHQPLSLRGGSEQIATRPRTTSTHAHAFGPKRDPRLPRESQCRRRSAPRARGIRCGVAVRRRTGHARACCSARRCCTPATRHR